MKGFGRCCCFLQLQLVVACVHDWEYVDYVHVWCVGVVGMSYCAIGVVHVIEWDGVGWGMNPARHRCCVAAAMARERGVVDGVCVRGCVW
jgi:hypothetical protein